MKSGSKEKNSRSINSATIFRLACIVVLWIIFCGWLVTRYIETNTPITLRTLFPIIASGIIVFVPLYKKYFKKTVK